MTLIGSPSGRRRTKETEWQKLTANPQSLTVKDQCQTITRLFILYITAQTLCSSSMSVIHGTCVVLLGGSEEKEPGEDQHKEGDASGSKEGQTQSSQDGNPTPLV